MSDQKVPLHVAVIMDGNGRWAKSKGFPRPVGHKYGVENFIKIAKYAQKIGVKYFTVYAFSTENWKRPKIEVEAIMTLFSKYLEVAVRDKDINKVAFKIIGDKSVFSDKMLGKITAAEEATSEYLNSCVCNIAVNYGSRSEIIAAANKAFAASGGEITEQLLEENLYFSGQPDPDLIIRTSGEQRISNFMLWQAAYSEFYFTDVLWPDFSEADFDAAIAEYQNRGRRFGGV